MEIGIKQAISKYGWVIPIIGFVYLLTRNKNES
jgi:hypothetical protein